MVSWRMGKSCFLIFGAFWVMSSSIWAVAASRIKLKGGTVYESVTFAVNKTFKVLSINGEDWKKDVSFTDVEAIFDEKGVDVTGDYLGDYVNKVIDKESSDKENWLSKTDTVVKSHNKPLWSRALSLSGNFSTPLGDYYKGNTSGIGFGGDLSFAISRSLAIRISVSKFGMNADASDLQPNSILIEDNLSFSAWQYSLSLQYYGGLKKDEERKLMYYLYGGLGVINHNFSGTWVVRDLTDDLLHLHTTAASGGIKFTSTTGLGMVAFVSNSFGLEFGAAADQVNLFNSNDSFQEGHNNQIARIFHLKAGIVTMF